LPEKRPVGCVKYFNRGLAWLRVCGRPLSVRLTGDGNLYYLIFFDIKSQDNTLKYPIPEALDLAILDESLEIMATKLLLFPELADASIESLLDSWSACLEIVANIVSRTEKRTLVFPTDKHFQVFQIIKQKCKLRTRATGYVILERISKDSGESSHSITAGPTALNEMLTIIRNAGPEKLSTQSDAFSISKEEKAKIGFITCDSYSHIIDTRTDVYHRKDSRCLQGVPVAFWRGTGKNPGKKGFTACPYCYRNTENTKKPSIVLKKELGMRLIDGAYAVD